MNTSLLEFSHVCKYYHMGDSTIHAADDVSFQIDGGEFVAIVGQSGSGKSTCMNILGCLDVPTSGNYTIGGIDAGNLSSDELSEIRNKMIGFIFQNYYLLAKLNALENVELPMIYAGKNTQDREKTAKECLKKVGLEKKILNYPNQLSGGEQQRVSIARALSNSPKVILADEPTGALDSKTGLEVIKLLQELNREGTTIVLITHNQELAKMARRTIKIEDGKIVSDDSQKLVTSEGKHADI